MKAELEKQLTGLSLEEKSEVVSFLMPFVTPEFDGEADSDALIKELEKRFEADKENPGAAISLDEFNKCWEHIG
jgi:hypothetical protein